MITIIDYGLNNVRSIVNAFDRIKTDCKVASVAEDLQGASGIVLPGVGSFDAGITALQNRGLVATLSKKCAAGIPVLGICLGMQMMAETSEESSEHKRGLGLFEGIAVRFNGNLKVPHMGWNRVKFMEENSLLAGLDSKSYMYFVHSYYLPTDKNRTIGMTDYGTSFASVVARKNVWGVQFHPEKSGSNGLRLLKNFALITKEEL